MNAIFVKFNRKDESSTFIFQIIKVHSQKKQEKTRNFILGFLGINVMNDIFLRLYQVI